MDFIQADVPYRDKAKRVPERIQRGGFFLIVAILVS
jgi:hypothetical protein